ncbi:hypothetical protein YC2023_002392 [Brassica napus]
MLVAREAAYAFYIDGKIYVMEDDRKDKNWMEVLDIKTQTWCPLLSHGATEFRGNLPMCLEERYTDMGSCGNAQVLWTYRKDVWCAIEDGKSKKEYME